MSKKDLSNHDELAQEPEELENLTDKSSRASVDSDLFIHHHKSNLWQSFVTLSKIFIGTGILGLPYAFQSTGLFASLVFYALVCIIVHQGIAMIVEVAADHRQDKEDTIYGVGYRVVGYKCGVSVEAFNILTNIGSGIAYIIYFITFMDNSFCGYQVDDMCQNYGVYALMAFIILGSLLFITSFHFLSYVNTVASCFIVWGIIAILIGSFVQMGQTGGSWSYFQDTFFNFDISQIPAFFGIAMFSCEGVANIFPVRSAMEEPSKFPKILKYTFLLVYASNVLVGVTGAVGFKQEINTIVINNLPTDNFYFASAQVIYAMAVVLTYPAIMFPTFETLEAKVHKKFPLFDNQGHTINKPLRFGMKFVILALSLLVGFVVKSFYYFISFLGSLGFTYLGIIFPIWAYQKQFKGRVSKLRTAVNYTMLVVGTILAIFGVIESFEKMVEAGRSDVRQK